jgi:threonine aldolase
MPLLLVDIQHLPYLRIQSLVALGQPLLKILMYGRFGYAKMLGSGPHCRTRFDHVHSQFADAFLHGICHILPSDAVCYQKNFMRPVWGICVLDTANETGYNKNKEIGGSSMICFHNDYSEGCHELILKRLQETNLEQTVGYGEDHYCAMAADKIRIACGRDDLAVHFLVGGTQANFTVISAALRPHQGVVCAESGHIHVHETGAVEATGHKILAVPSADGKVTANQVEQVVLEQRDSGSAEHMVQPKMVYISNPTELGTLYTLEELTALHQTCRLYGLYLFLDGARLGYGLTAKDNDVTLQDIARLCDVFYIGGTKMGALFGEAVVIAAPAIAEDFRYLIKQHGGMLAKGRLLGLQFDTLFTDELYFDLGRHANAMADQIRGTLESVGVSMYIPGCTNQLFPVFSDAFLAELGQNFLFTEQCRVDDTRRAVRFCTSWATTQENVNALCAEIQRIHKNFIGNSV